MRVTTAISCGLLCLAWTVGCSFRGTPKAAAAPPASAPKPAPPSVTAKPPQTPEAPYSTPQTTVDLPTPQPVNAAAAAALPQPPLSKEPEPAEPPRARRPVTSGAPAAAASPAPEPVPAPPPQPTRRLRVTESAAERRRLQHEVGSRQRETEENLTRAQRRQLSADERVVIERVRAFLEQAQAALRKNDFQEADAMSSRAVLLSRDLVRE